MSNTIDPTRGQGNRASEINRLHKEFGEGLRLTLEKAVHIGELLVAAKAECGHGNWLSWIKTNLSFSEETANRYMRCFYNREQLNSPSAGYLTIEDAARMSSQPSEEEAAINSSLPTNSPSVPKTRPRTSAPTRVEKEEKSETDQRILNYLTQIGAQGVTAEKLCQDLNLSDKTGFAHIIGLKKKGLVTVMVCPI
jgi:hypothetical protein